MKALLTQTTRLIHYLRAHPGASSLEIVRDLQIVNTTGRISDLRASGVEVVCRKVDGVSRFYVVERPEPIRGEQIGAFGS